VLANPADNNSSRYPLSTQTSPKSTSNLDEVEPSSSGHLKAERANTAWRSIAGVVDLKHVDIVL